MTDGRRLAIGLSLPTWPLRGGGYASWADMRAVAREAEALGVDTLWVPDHLLRTMKDRPRFGFWECWTILTAAAEATTRIEIGPFIACTGFRNPGLLAKMAMTLDEVSGGRVVLGLGSGVPARDPSWSAFGYDGTRHVSRYAEAVEIVTRLLRERSVTFAGEHYRMDEAEIIPRGPRPDGPPVWVAGMGERTSRVAARWGDAINVNTPLASLADLERIRGLTRDGVRGGGSRPRHAPADRLGAARDRRRRRRGGEGRRVPLGRPRRGRGDAGRVRGRRPRPHDPLPGRRR